MGGGGTLILVLSNAADATADFFVERLRARNRSFVRVDTERLETAWMTMTLGGESGTVAACAMFDETPVDASDVHAIYYRRPRPPAVTGEGLTAGEREWVGSELRRAWGGWFAMTPARWVNHPLSISGASYKPEQLARAQRMGLTVPDTLITKSPKRAREFAIAHGEKVIVKPVSHGEIRDERGHQERLIYTTALYGLDQKMLDRVVACPSILQRCIEKDIDIRVTVVGDEVLSVALHSQERLKSSVDCRRDNMRGMRYSCIDTPADLEGRLKAYVQSYNLVYAAIDLVRDIHGTYWFLEINPAGQWAWLEQQTGIGISDAIIRACDAG